MIEIRKVQAKSDWKHFFAVPLKIYKDDLFYVPPLQIAQTAIFDKKNPFFEHASLEAFVAFRGKQAVGRIVCIIDEDYCSLLGEKAAFFGFFEAMDEVSAQALLAHAMTWTKEHGLEVLRGPMNPSINHECGLLIKGFQYRPFVMMPYNKPQYGDYLEQAGFVKIQDLFAYHLSAATSQISERMLRHAERLRMRGRFVFRPLNMAAFDSEVDLLLDIYNDAWEKNWGFVPMRPAEFRAMAKDMKLVVDPELCLIAEVEGKAVAFALALPDINQALVHVKEGRLTPLNLLKLFWYLKGPAAKRTITQFRVITLGVRKTYQESGIGPLMYTEFWRRGVAKGLCEAEASWILENNVPMNTALEALGAEKTKVYRIYERKVTSADTGH